MTAEVEVWHYASPRPSIGSAYCWPICWDKQPLSDGRTHGQTLLRQDVTCPECLRMMSGA